MEYPVKHHGVVIVCGGGPDLPLDLERALRARPDADLVGANFAAAVVPAVRHVWTQHAEIAGKIKRQSNVKVHARPAAAQTKSSGIKTDDDVDYPWPDLAWVAGSSGFAAALWARHGLGYEEVILAGVPLEAEVRRYGRAYEAAAVRGCRPPEYDSHQHYSSESNVLHWQALIHRFIDEGRTEGITSVSGWTARVLGQPT